MVSTCPSLSALDLSDNEMHKLVEVPAQWFKLCDAIGNSSTLTDLNLNRNWLGPKGVHIAANQLRNMPNLLRLGLSFNEPGSEPALAEMLRAHKSLTSIELEEELDRHLPSRTKDDIGRALMDNPSRCLGFLHCNRFKLSESARTLTWPAGATTSDAVLLAGVLRTNTVLTTFNIAANASLENKGRSEIGAALLSNPNPSVAYCNDFGLAPGVTQCEFDLAKPELKEIDPFRLLAGCLRGNRTLTHLTLRQLRMEQLPSLALAFQGNSTMQKLEIISLSRSGGQAIAQLAVPEFNGNGSDGAKKHVDATKMCIEGALNRVACATIGMLITTNSVIECLDLSHTGLGNAIGSEAEGGHILFKPLCESKLCSLAEIVLDDVQLSDKAGGKLINALTAGLAAGDTGYEKVTALSLARNELGKQFTTALKQLLWSERAQCMLQTLNVSDNPALDGFDLAVALKRNDSLTAIDVRGVPGANMDDIYVAIGSHLLLDACTCRLGCFACDAFQMNTGLEELEYSCDGRATLDERTSSPPLAMGSKADPVISLLAGVLKFSTSLRRLTLAAGLTDAGASSLATAMRENKCLEHLDVSRADSVGTVGIEELSAALRLHPKLQSLTLDSKPLPVAQLVGGDDANPSLDVAGMGLGERSSFAMGALFAGNRLVSNVNVANNPIGARGIERLVRGLSDSPLKALNIARTGLQEADDTAISALTASLCRLGLMSELVLDENELSCSEATLAPICKLRQLRTLSLEKNKLSRIPNLIGTMLSLRKLRLFSNGLTELPASLCLLTALEVLDVHKNSITALPANIGKLTMLQKLDVSENRLVELPILICELSEDLALFVGRNPLEKPSIEQARQGIGAIRRFFNYTKKDATDAFDASTAAHDAMPSLLQAQTGESLRNRPTRSADGSSRHDWASPGGSILLFNCCNCPFVVAEGGDPSALAQEDDVKLIAVFNLQVVGRLKPLAASSSTGAERFSERVDFANEWLPWHDSNATAGEQRTLVVEARGRRKAGVMLIVRPWLAYGCSIGARLKVQSAYCTVTAICEDGRCEVVRDGTKVDQQLTSTDRVDPTPETVTRTSSFSYKNGQRLMLLQGGRFTDAVVDAWLGIRRGSRHTVRIVASDKAAAGGRADSPPPLGMSFRRRGSVGGPGRNHLEVDLNDLNHAKLLFPSVAKYEAALAAYLDSVATKNATVKDLSTELRLPSADQRVFLRPGSFSANTAGNGSAPDPKIIEVFETIDADGSGGIDAKELRQALKMLGINANLKDAQTIMAKYDSDHSKALGQPEFARLVQDLRNHLGKDLGALGALGGAAQTPDAAQQQHASAPAPDEAKTPTINALSLVDRLLAPETADAADAARLTVVRTYSQNEGDLLQVQLLHALARTVHFSTSSSNSRCVVPALLSMARLAEMSQDESRRTNPREMVLSTMALDHLGMTATPDMLRQATELHAVVVVADVRSDTDLAVFQDAPLCEELASYRLLIVAAADVLERAGTDALPASFRERCALYDVDGLGLHFGDAALENPLAKALFGRLAAGAMHFDHVSSLHLSTSQLGVEAMTALAKLLTADTCCLKRLDVSFTRIDARALVEALKTNGSLTALDVRKVPKMAAEYGVLGELLLAPGSKCRLGYLRCDAFELLEGEASLSLREAPIDKGAAQLLTGLLKTNNRTLRELDLAATGFEIDWATALITALPASGASLTALHLPYNPTSDPESQAVLHALVKEHDLKVALHF